MLSVYKMWKENVNGRVSNKTRQFSSIFVLRAIQQTPRHRRKGPTPSSTLDYLQHGTAVGA